MNPSPTWVAYIKGGNGMLNFEMIMFFSVFFLFLYFPFLLGWGCALFYLISFLLRKLIPYKKMDKKTRLLKQEKRNCWFYNICVPVIIYSVAFMIWHLFNALKVVNWFVWGAFFFLFYLCYHLSLAPMFYRYFRGRMFRLFLILSITSSCLCLLILAGQSV